MAVLESAFSHLSQTGTQRLSMEDEEDLALAGVILEQSDFEQALNVMQSTHSDAIGAPKVSCSIRAYDCCFQNLRLFMFIYKTYTRYFL